MQRVAGESDPRFGILQRTAFLDRVEQAVIVHASSPCPQSGQQARAGLRGVKRRAALAVPPLILAGCEGPLSALAPAGPVAAAISGLWWAMLAGAGVLALMVFALFALGFRAPRPVAEARWTLGLGLALPLVVLAGLLAATLWAGARILPLGEAVEVRAHARQWGWRFGHPGAPDTGTVLHIPAGRPVDVLITAEDVIHSFWVPRLGGKMDAIPGRQNRLRIEAAQPGTYDGLCAEFCGLDHALMRFEVVAHAEWPPGAPETEQANPVPPAQAAPRPGGASEAPPLRPGGTGVGP